MTDKEASILKLANLGSSPGEAVNLAGRHCRLVQQCYPIPIKLFRMALISASHPFPKQNQDLSHSSTESCPPHQ